MRLLLDAGNTRLKWRLERDGIIIEAGSSALDLNPPLASIRDYLESVSRVGISTVTREDIRLQLSSYLEQNTSGEVRFYWAEAERSGLKNSYTDAGTMGADRWHGMYGAWKQGGGGFAVVDAGSAITVDYVNHAGQHLGGYILPGLNMMLKSLKSDAARIAFESGEMLEVRPGTNTAEGVNQGLSWLLQAMTERIANDVSALGLVRILVTGGDAGRLLALGMEGEHCPSLVLDGLGYIASEDSAK